MKENWFNSMFMENGKVSHKRWISVSIASVLSWCIIFAIVKATGDKGREAIINSTMIFVLVMSGVATIPQIASIIRGGTATKDDKPEPPKP